MAVPERYLRLEYKDDLGTIKVIVICPFCSIPQPMFVVDQAAWTRWRNGELVQRAFPDITTEQRELLATGTCAHCWEDITAGI